MNDPAIRVRGLRKSYRDVAAVAVLGIDPARATRDFRSRVGIVSQTPNDLLELTVTEVVRHFAGYIPRPIRSFEGRPLQKTRELQ